jgi:hypothetical protein
MFSEIPFNHYVFLQSHATLLFYCYFPNTFIHIISCKMGLPKNGLRMPLQLVLIFWRTNTHNPVKSLLNPNPEPSLLTCRSWNYLLPSVLIKSAEIFLVNQKIFSWQQDEIRVLVVNITTDDFVETKENPILFEYYCNRILNCFCEKLNGNREGFQIPFSQPFYQSVRDWKDRMAGTPITKSNQIQIALLSFMQRTFKLNHTCKI